MEPSSDKPKRGRPSSGVPRKEQIRRAVQKHRRQSKFGEGSLLQIELPVYLLMEIRGIASRDGKSVREVVTGMLENGWREDYLAQNPGEGTRPIREKAADELIAKWRREFRESFEK